MTERQPYVGRRVRSKEAPRLVSGQGRYVDDLSLPRMLHAAVLRSPYAHARILSANAAAAAAMPGVRGVVLPDDVKRLTRPFKPGRYAAGLRVPIAEHASAVDKVRYVGEAMGRRPLVIPVPALVGRALLGVTETAARIARRTTILTADKANEFFQPAWTGDPTPLTRDSGWSAVRDLRTGLAETYRWYRGAGWL